MIGYARVSTTGQDAGYEAQVRDLEAAGIQKMFQEKVSSVAERDELLKALDFVRDGDVLVVTKLDRLARSVKHMWEIIERLEKKNVSLRILNLGIDTASATGKLILTILGGVAQFERELLLERQLEGIAKAKAEGKYKGRKPFAIEKREAIHALLAEHVPKAQVARRLGVGRQTVYRVSKEARPT